MKGGVFHTVRIFLRTTTSRGKHFELGDNAADGSHTGSVYMLINGDCTDKSVIDSVSEHIYKHSHRCTLIIADPPYGNIVTDKWDKTFASDIKMARWINDWAHTFSREWLEEGGAMYIFGGTGRVDFRPFYRFLATVEVKGELQLANHITWSKKRAYGVRNNYLYTREEIAYLIKGDAKKPLKFDPPYLSEKRGYAGYNAKYPAKSEYFRRTNVWTDITEIFKGKVHSCQKPVDLLKVMILAHTEPGDLVIDPFAGSGTTGVAAKELGREYLLIEQCKDNCEIIKRRLES